MHRNPHHKCLHYFHLTIRILLTALLSRSVFFGLKKLSAVFSLTRQQFLRVSAIFKSVCTSRKISIMEGATLTIRPRRPTTLQIQPMETFCSVRTDTLCHIANCESCLEAFYAAEDALARMVGNFDISLDSSELDWFKQVHSTISQGAPSSLLKCAKILKQHLERLLLQQKSPVENLHDIPSSVQPFVFTSSDNCDDKDCVICMENFVKGDKGYRIKRCSHEFHENCLNEWTKTSTSCPLCRTSIQKCHVFNWCKKQFK